MSHLQATQRQNRKKSTSASPDKNSQVPDGKTTHPSLLCLAGTELCLSLPLRALIARLLTWDRSLSICRVRIIPLEKHWKFPGVQQLSQFPRELSHHQPQAAQRNGKGSGPSPSSFPPFLFADKTTTSTFNNILVWPDLHKFTSLTRRKAGSSALWLLTFFRDRKSTVNILFWRESKKQSKKVSAVLGNFLCTGSLIKPGERKQ